MRKFAHTLGLGGRKARLLMATDVTDTLKNQRELQVSEIRLRALNLELEDRIGERTRELVEARDRAEAADRVKSLFLATVSHELRTPLNSIIGFSDALLRELAGPLEPEQAKQLRIVRDAGHQLLALIGDILDISKIEAGVVSYDLAELDLSALLPTVADAFAEGGKAGIEFGLLDSVGPCVVRADAQRVRQVVGNYLSNALKFTDHGRITLGVERQGDGARVSVRDTGIGIAAAESHRLFQPFIRLAAKGSRSSEGTGLGLAIARRLAEGMGGRSVSRASQAAAATSGWTCRSQAARSNHAHTDDRRGRPGRRRGGGRGLSLGEVQVGHGDSGDDDHHHDQRHQPHPGPAGLLARLAPAARGPRPPGPACSGAWLLGFGGP